MIKVVKVGEYTKDKAAIHDYELNYEFLTKAEVINELHLTNHVLEILRYGDGVYLKFMDYGGGGIVILYVCPE